VYEIGISYSGRTYEEGKKIGVKDGFRALYCILHYNLPYAPAGVQFAAYAVVGGIAAMANLLLFLGAMQMTSIAVAAGIAFVLAAGLNYWLCVLFLFRHRSRWSAPGELTAYAVVMVVAGTIDVFATVELVRIGMTATSAKLIASAIGLLFNFLSRRYFVFPDFRPGPWAPSR
jgi:putative flippase GtrA